VVAAVSAGTKSSPQAISPRNTAAVARRTLCDRDWLLIVENNLFKARKLGWLLHSALVTV
jgi:hypothetical protein